MQFKKLSVSFVKKTENLEEVLDDKGRGYCVAEVTYEGMCFAVPLRTKLPNKNGKAIKIGGAPTAFITDVVNDPKRGPCYRGLHYEKALLLSDRCTDLAANYPLTDSFQRTFLNDNEYKICKEFKRYVDAYVRAHKNNLPFKGMFYRSTLRNYHAEFGIES